uniref:Uncharacterized protein n=1 Tax=Heterorhabditis bacteriophora TaxID=37862 RepID=A0A1I7WJP7_HETBA
MNFENCDNSEFVFTFDLYFYVIDFVKPDNCCRATVSALVIFMYYFIIKVIDIIYRKSALYYALKLNVLRIISISGTSVEMLPLLIKSLLFFHFIIRYFFKYTYNIAIRKILVCLLDSVLDFYDYIFFL